MHPQPFRPNLGLALVGFTVLFGLVLVGVRSLQPERPRAAAPVAAAPLSAGSAQSLDFAAAPPAQADGVTRRTSGGPIYTPTPDNPHPLPQARTQVEQYTVQPGESLAGIAQRFQISVDQLARDNGLANPNYVEVGQALTISLPSAENAGPAFKIIPDSELVNGPAAAGFDLEGFIQGQGGYLSGYSEEINDRSYTGAEIIARIAQEYSVNPRLLLAVLEYQSGWVTKARPPEPTWDYPMRLSKPHLERALPPDVLGGQPVEPRLLPVAGQWRPAPGCWRMGTSSRFRP